MGSPASLMVLRRVLDEGVMRSEEVLDRALAAARDPAGEGGRTFLRIYENTARAQAHAADADPSTGATRGALAGIPVSIKDNFDVEGGVTRAGSASLEHAPPARCDSEVVARLKAAGAVIVGRTNMTVFAYSGIGINPHFGTPLNPFDRATGRIHDRVLPRRRPPVQSGPDFQGHRLEIQRIVHVGRQRYNLAEEGPHRNFVQGEA